MMHAAHRQRDVFVLLQPPPPATASGVNVRPVSHTASSNASPAKQPQAALSATMQQRRDEEDKAKRELNKAKQTQSRVKDFMKTHKPFDTTVQSPDATSPSRARVQRDIPVETFVPRGYEGLLQDRTQQQQPSLSSHALAGHPAHVVPPPLGKIGKSSSSSASMHRSMKNLSATMAHLEVSVCVCAGLVWSWCGRCSVLLDVCRVLLHCAVSSHANKQSQLLSALC